LDVIVAILGAALGLGLVIFIHELGHFVAARWCGVHVERFSIGFGPVLWRWVSRQTGTEFAVSLIPLGGYIKMLGQDDTNPAASSDSSLRQRPDSYPARPVWQRMLIVSAGVLANILLGFFCFSLLFNLGVPYLPPIIGWVKPGAPAWKAGLAPGDQVVAINDRPVLEFDDLLLAVRLSNPNEGGLDLRIRRGQTERTVHVVPQLRGYWPEIGAAPSFSNILRRNNRLPDRLRRAGLQAGDRILGVDGQAVNDAMEIRALLAADPSKVVQLTIERSGPQTPPQQLPIRLEPQPFRALPIVLAMGPAVAVRSDGAAQKAQLAATGAPFPIQPGDQLVSVEDKAIDPFRFPDEVRSMAGRPVRLRLRRIQDGAARDFEVLVTPTAEPTWLQEPFAEDAPIECPGLGIAYYPLPEIKTVHVEELRASNPEAVGMLRPGDRIAAAQIRLPAEAQEVGLPEVLDWFGLPASGEGLPYLFWLLQAFEQAELTLRLSRTEEGEAAGPEVTLRPMEDPGWLLSTRGLALEAFEPHIERLPPLGLWGSIRRGWSETVSMAQSVYLQLERMFVSQTVSPKSLRGPITIVRVLYSAAKEDLVGYLQVIAHLSLMLAILNFLPIPLLDGGHMVFLLWEAIRGSPPSVRVQVGLSLAGLLLLVSLMAWALAMDLLSLL
jgi:regulator of sigma E protease